MACLLQLQQGGHLAKQDGNGFLLLNVCNDVVQPIGGGGPPSNYKPVHVQRNEYLLEQKRLKAERDAKEKKIVKKERQIERLESKRKSDLADQAMQRELLELIRQSEQLRQQKAELEAAIAWAMRQEDDLIVILLSLPFVS